MIKNDHKKRFLMHGGKREKKETPSKKRNQYYVGPMSNIGDYNPVNFIFLKN